MWEFYLAVAEASFRTGATVIYQFQITKKIDTLPITRDYIIERERHLLEIEKSLDNYQTL